MAHISSKFLVLRKYGRFPRSSTKDNLGGSDAFLGGHVFGRMSGTVALSGAINTPGDTGLQPQSPRGCAPANQPSK